MKYVYPAILYPADGRIGVKVPDLPECLAEGADVADALFLAKDAIERWLWNAENNAEAIPPASESLRLEEGETITLIAADMDEYRRTNDTHAVKKTVSIPSWLNTQAEKANAPFSQILQEGLKSYLGISEK